MLKRPLDGCGRVVLASATRVVEDRSRVALGVQSQQVLVESKQQFDTAIQHYISMGYAPRQMSNEFAILSRQSEQKGLGCGFVFWCVAFFPVALIMLMNRSKQLGEHTITIRLQQASTPPLPRPEEFAPALPEQLQMSEDRKSWWDGRTWVRADQASPPMARRSADGNLWWDGETWRAVM